MNTQELRKASQEFSKLLDKNGLRPSFSSRQKLWNHFLKSYKKSKNLATELEVMDTTMLFIKRFGEVRQIGEYRKDSLRHTNPYLKKLSNTELRSLISKSVDTSTRIEKDM